MKEHLKPYRLFVLLALLCTLAAAWLVVFRIRVEEPQGRHFADEILL